MTNYSIIVGLTAHEIFGPKPRAPYELVPHENAWPDAVMAIE
jgi:hypothetical protein